MFQLIEQLHLISTKHNLKLAPEKSFFILFKVKFLGHKIGYYTIKPKHSSKVDTIHKIPSPTSKVTLMTLIGELSFNRKFNEKLHLNLKPFMSYYMRILRGHGLLNMKLCFTSLKSLSLLIQNLQYLIQNILFSLQLMLHKSN